MVIAALRLPRNLGPRRADLADEASAAGQGTRPTNVFGQGDFQESYETSSPRHDGKCSVWSVSYQRPFCPVKTMVFARFVRESTKTTEIGLDVSFTTIDTGGERPQYEVVSASAAPGR